MRRPTVNKLFSTHFTPTLTRASTPQRLPRISRTYLPLIPALKISTPARAEEAKLGITIPPRPWDGSHVVVPITTAQLAAILNNSAGFTRGDDLFSLSPLTSPESTPPSTRPPSPSSAPTHTRTAAEPSQQEQKRQRKPKSQGRRQRSAKVAAGLGAASPALTGDTTPPQSQDKPSSSAGGRERKQRFKSQSRRQRKVQRVAQQDAAFGDAPLPSGAQEKYFGTAEAAYTPWDTEREAEVTSAGFTSLDFARKDAPLDWTRTYRLDELVGPNSQYKLRLQEWDGTAPVAIVDLEGRIFGIMAGAPPDEDWEEMHQAAARLLENAGRECRLPKDSAHHRRGEFTTMRCGFSHGGGSTEPANCANGKVNQRILDGLVAAEPFRRIAGFGSSVMKTWAPNLHRHYVDNLGQLQARLPRLKRPFTNSVFPTITFNLGPRTVCKPHRDFANLPFGLCAITALGSFDSKKGGHLVLWECGLVIEFPAGSTILIPSSIVTHFNTAVGESEVRYSATQYAAGGLFRWVAHEFKLTNAFRKSLSPASLARHEQENKDRWANGLGLLPRVPFAVLR